MAQDASEVSENHSPFSRAFVQSAREFQTLPNFLLQMKDALAQASGARQAIELEKLDFKAEITTIFPLESQETDIREQSSQPLLSTISTSTGQSSAQDGPQVSTSSASMV